MAAPRPQITAAALVRSVKADLGALVRRNQAETLTEDDFLALTGRMRRCLNELEAQAIDAEEDDGGAFALTDLGAAVGRLTDAGVIGPHRELVRGLEGRVRAYRHLAVLDGGAKPETTLKGA